MNFWSRRATNLGLDGYVLAFGSGDPLWSALRPRFDHPYHETPIFAPLPLPL